MRERSSLACSAAIPSSFASAVSDRSGVDICRRTSGKQRFGSSWIANHPCPAEVCRQASKPDATTVVFEQLRHQHLRLQRQISHLRRYVDRDRKLVGHQGAIDMQRLPADIASRIRC